MALLSKHKEVESELAAARERLQEQASDLVLKASMSAHSLAHCSTKSRGFTVHSKQYLNISTALLI